MFELILILTLYNAIQFVLCHCILHLLCILLAQCCCSHVVFLMTPLKTRCCISKGLFSVKFLIWKIIPVNFCIYNHVYLWRGRLWGMFLHISLPSRSDDYSQGQSSNPPLAVETNDQQGLKWPVVMQQCSINSTHVCLTADVGPVGFRMLEFHLNLNAKAR